MFGHPVGIRGGPTPGQAAAEAGLPHAEVPGDLRKRVERVLADEPDHPDPPLLWSRHADESDRRFGIGRFLWPHRHRLAGAFALVSAETVAVQLGPVLTQIGVDDGIAARDRGVLAAAALAYAALLAAAAAVGAARVSFTGRLGERLLERLRMRVFSHMQRQSVNFYAEQRAGVLLTRMTSDIEALSVLFQEGFVNFAVQALTLIVITVLLFHYDPLLAVITLAAAAPPTVAASMWFRRRSASDYRNVRERIAELLSDLQESLAGIRVITAHDRRDANIADHRRVVARHRDASLRASRANSLYGPGSEAIGIATQSVLLAVGGAMAARGRISVGELAAYLLFLTSFFAPVQALVQLYNSYQQGGAAVAKLRDLLATEPTVQDLPGAEVLPRLHGNIDLEDVSFAYPTSRRALHSVGRHRADEPQPPPDNRTTRPASRHPAAEPQPPPDNGDNRRALHSVGHHPADEPQPPPDNRTARPASRRVLHGVSLSIAAGETLAVVGETGAGKSTIARLIARLYDPDEGAVRIDGRDLRDVTLTSLRSQIGVVPQEPFLFAGTVRQNVGFARPAASDDELRAALRAVGIEDVVERLGGLDGIVHERGSTLSAGERQLLALARTLVSEPRVLVLDEATSNLDLLSEARIEQALDVLLSNRTAVVIAHRLSTAKRADRIAVVHGGRIVELGTHSELVASGGRYATMFKTWESHSQARPADGPPSQGRPPTNGPNCPN